MQRRENEQRKEAGYISRAKEIKNEISTFSNLFAREWNSCKIFKSCYGEIQFAPLTLLGSCI